MAGSKTQAKQQTRKHTQRQEPKGKHPEPPQEEVSYTSEMIVWVVCACMLIVELGNFGLCGFINYVSRFLFGMVGVVEYVLPLVVMFAAFFLHINQYKKRAVQKVVFGCCVLLCIGMMGQMYEGVEEFALKDWYLGGYQSRIGGGILCGLVAWLLHTLVGQVGTYIVIALAIILCVVLLAEVSLIDFFKEFGASFAQSFEEEMSARDEEEFVEERVEPAPRNRKKRRKKYEEIIEEDYPEEKKSTGTSVLDSIAVLPADTEQGILPASRTMQEQDGVSEIRMDQTVNLPGENMERSGSRRRRREVVQEQGEQKIVKSIVPSVLPVEGEAQVIPSPFDEAADLPWRMSGKDRKEDAAARTELFKEKPETEFADFSETKYDTGIPDLSEAKHDTGKTEFSEGKRDTEKPVLSQGKNRAWADQPDDQPQPIVDNSGSGSQQDTDEGQLYEALMTSESDEDDGMDPDEAARQLLTSLNKRGGIRSSGKETEKAAGREPVPGRIREDRGQTSVSGNAVSGGEIENLTAAPVKTLSAKEIGTSDADYRFPPLELLKKGKTPEAAKGDIMRQNAVKLQEVLKSFGVNVTMTNFSCGPSVTRYEMVPEQGVKVSKITGLADDLMMNLAAQSIRIEAPIPGKSAVGIEIPNEKRTGVGFRELIDTEKFKKHPSRIAVAIGKDIEGNVVVEDLAKMPHLLIAGATGSGKSVCTNTLIMSILFKARPDEVKLILIDPKQVELKVYNGIPHLLTPVVTDAKKASGALNWAVVEMTDRYQKFSEYNVRNIQGYNAKVEEALNSGKVEDDKLQKMPQIVIIVDELADLMMVAKAEVEEAIVRLAQLARAAGIHLVIATQRPSVDVVTGLIKANVPSRIALSVSSGVDSRTIIDSVGAEKLLGNGDMLFYPTMYPKPLRVQGAYISDDEVVDIVEFLKTQNGEGAYNESVTSRIESSASGTSVAIGGGDTGSELDEYFVQAGKFIIEKNKASIGMLQRMYKVGFNRAARIMDQLCDAGVVGPEEGTKPRQVLMSEEQFEQYIEEYY